jgi:AraC-like DNA-binding protein
MAAILAAGAPPGLEETRQIRPGDNGPMAGRVDPTTRGLLDPHGGPGRYEEGLHPVSADLAEVLVHGWGVRWDLRGREPHTVQVLPQPSVQLVFEDGRATVHGVGTTKFVRRLEGRGDIFGVAFRPAGFRSFLGSPVTALTDRVVPAVAVFGPAVEELARRTSALTQRARQVEAAEAFIRRRLPAPDPQVPAINRLVALVMDDRTIVRVDDIVRRAGTSKRTLQRLFREYVGVTPKWVIQRYRLHEAADRLAGDEELDLAALAFDLGYADQSHFARDFKAVVGRPPAGYARTARRAG